MKPYRARRVDNNELVYGGGFEHKGKTYIIPADIRILPLGYTLGPPSLDGFVEVHPSTVSQSTGRKDKHGVEVYRGMTLSSDSGGLFKVVWVDLLAAFWVVEQTTPYQKYTAEIIEKLEIIPEGE